MTNNTSRAQRRRMVTRLGLWILLAATVALSAGCGMLSQEIEKPHPSTTISGFMKQPRPGEGIIGP